MSHQHEQDVLDTLDVLLHVVRDVKPDGLSTYKLSMKEDPDRVIAKTNSRLAQMFDEGKIDRELRVIAQHLHSGECVVWRDTATDKAPAGAQGCLDKIRSLLVQAARERQYDPNKPGKLCGATAEEVAGMSPKDLEEYRKVVCSQRTGGVQLENKVFYYLGNNLEVGKNAGATQFVHKAIGRRFREATALWKDPSEQRVYWIQFQDRLVASKLTEAKRELKTSAELAEQRRKEAAEKKLKAKGEKAKAKKKEDAAVSEPAHAGPSTD